jgi:predicted oxidoreductase
MPEEHRATLDDIDEPNEQICFVLGQVPHWFLRCTLGYRGDLSLSARDGDALLVHQVPRGCNLIDTAASYTNGGSEKLIGEVLADHPGYDPLS